MNLTLWIIAGLLAAAFLVAGASKLFIPKVKLAKAPGAGWVLEFSAGFVKALGAVEILGAVGLAGAWPALAGRAGRPWRRFALGACGWVWLALLAPITGSALYLSAPPGVGYGLGWEGSLHATTAQVIRPILSSGVLLAAPVWGCAACVLPVLLSAQPLSRRATLVAAWAAATVGCASVVLAIAGAGAAAIPLGAAAVGAVAGAACGLGPKVLRELAPRPPRVSRARPSLP